MIKHRRDGKSALPQRFIGFDLGSKDKSVAIIFDEDGAIYNHIQSFPVPIIKSGEIFTYSTPFNEAVSPKSKEEPDEIE